VKSFNGREYLFLLFLIVFVGDSAAYFAGKFFGKRKLAPHLSPKKTVEGAFGSVCGATLISILWLRTVYPDPWDSTFGIRLMVFAPLLNVFAQVGDLFESLLKRSQEVKDSGAFLPGHGGILDRLDGIAFSAPLFYFFVTYILETGA
jgi:phosphatidate cytidylyltransferase